METYMYIIFGVVAVILIAIITLLITSKKSKQSNIDARQIIDLLDKTNIVSVDFIRNKIVIEFKDVTQFDGQALKDSGALGINIVGDKVKFYFDDTNDTNLFIFKEIKNFLER